MGSSFRLLKILRVLFSERIAEIYKSDTDYEPGTVVVFGGEHEVTQCNR